jgi:mannose-6-phosphate isomerase class I
MHSNGLKGRDRPNRSLEDEAMTAASGKKPIIFRASLNPVLKHYAWGGFDLARWLKRPVERVAEIWFCSTQIDGVSLIGGVSFAGIVAANPKAMLGSRFTSKPTFSKVLAKDQSQPQIVQIGFNEKIVGRETEFISWMKEERRLVVQLKDALNRILAHIWNKTERLEAFEEYRRCYEAWVCEETAVGWTGEHFPSFTGTKLKTAIRDSGFEAMAFGPLIDVRRELCSYLNTIELEPGQNIIAPVGYIHSIVGSHQTHPLVNEAKTEAWHVFSPDLKEAGKDVVFYFEPQQTANTTYSLFDFPTPIVYVNDRAEMRKDLTRGLGAILSTGEEPPETDEEAIQCIAERTVRFIPTEPRDFIVNPGARNVSGEYQAKSAYAERAIGGSYRLIQLMPFIMDNISLNGSKQASAQVTIMPLEDSYSDIVVLEGEVVLSIDSRKEILTAGDAIFFPASDKSSRLVTASTNARLMRIYPPQDSGWNHQKTVPGRASANAVGCPGSITEGEFVDEVALVASSKTIVDVHYRDP